MIQGLLQKHLSHAVNQWFTIVVVAKEVIIDFRRRTLKRLRKRKSKHRAIR